MACSRVNLIHFTIRMKLILWEKETRFFNDPGNTVTLRIKSENLFQDFGLCGMQSALFIAPYNFEADKTKEKSQMKQTELRSYSILQEKFNYFGALSLGT